VNIGTYRNNITDLAENNITISVGSARGHVLSESPRRYYSRKYEKTVPHTKKCNCLKLYNSNSYADSLSSFTENKEYIYVLCCISAE
jgi:hypothetical protein